ncbi:MAG: class I SAM-dependent DNA methyltransferase [Fimbriimonadales bacterium]
MRRAKPSGKPTTRVREILERLGYVEHEDFEYEVEVRLYGNRRLYADVMLFQGDTPIVVVEVEGRAEQLRAGFEEARFKGAAWNLENPVPLLWVAAGDRDVLYRLSSQHAGICYEPLQNDTPEDALSPAQLARLIGKYLQRSDTLLGQALRDRELLRRALLSVQGDTPRTRVVNLLNLLQSQRSSTLRQTPLRDLRRRVENARRSGASDFALASAMRHIARDYFRPVVPNDEVRRLGQYYTPDEVVELLVEAAAPQPDMQILDFACGSGGFLLHAARYLIEQHRLEPQAVAACLHGFEYEPNAQALASMVVQLATGQTAPNVRQTNSLDYSWEENAYDLILCNPPAGEIQVSFLRSRFRYAGKGQGRVNLYEAAFAELAVRLTKPQGRIALVIPEGLLSNAVAKPLRRWLFRQARPVAILGLPRGLFPHTPSRMYALLMAKSPPSKQSKCLIAELERYDLTAGKQALLRLIREAWYA